MHVEFHEVFKALYLLRPTHEAHILVHLTIRGKVMGVWDWLECHHCNGLGDQCLYTDLQCCMYSSY